MKKGFVKGLSTMLATALAVTTICGGFSTRAFADDLSGNDEPDSGATITLVVDGKEQNKTVESGDIPKDPKKKDADFVGWSTEKESNDKETWINGELPEFAEDTTLYAVFTSDTYYYFLREDKSMDKTSTNNRDYMYIGKGTAVVPDGFKLNQARMYDGEDVDNLNKFIVETPDEEAVKQGIVAAYGDKYISRAYKWSWLTMTSTNATRGYDYSVIDTKNCLHIDGKLDFEKYLTVNYIFGEDGTQAHADSFVKDLFAGDSYSVTSPEILGYTPDVAVVYGTMGDDDCVVTVTYSINEYTVTFVDFDGTVLGTSVVKHGGDATAPVNPSRNSVVNPDGSTVQYTFSGWDKEYTNVSGNMIVTALYNAETVAPIPEPGPAPEPTPEDPTPVAPTPVNPTPVNPTPVAPTPVAPTPVAPTPVEPTPVIEDTVEAPEVVVEIVDDKVALAPTVLDEIEIEDEETPLAAADHCFIHWVILLISLIYGLYAVVRALAMKDETKEEETKTAEN